jgi:hypothetical protein
MTPKSEDEAREILGVTAATPFVSVTAQGIIIAAGYSEALARLLRWVPKATWQPGKRAWVVPFAGADAVRSVLPEIMRLAEAAIEESREEKAPTVGESIGPSFGKEWLAALSQAASRGTEDIAALTHAAATKSIDRGAIENLVAALRAEAVKISGGADRLEAWLKNIGRDDKA